MHGGDRRQHSGEKGTGIALFLREISAGPDDSVADFEDAEEVQRHQVEEDGERSDEDRVLELEAPSEGLAARADGEEDRGEDPKRNQNSEGEDEAVLLNLTAVRAELVREFGYDPTESA